MRKSIRDAIVREAKAAEVIYEAAARENRELTDVENDKIAEHLGKAEALEISGKKEDEFRKKFTDMTSGLDFGGDDEPPNPDPTPAPQPGPEGAKAATRQSLGEMFIKSAEWKQLLASAPGGQFSEKRRVQSNPFSTKTLLTGANHTTSAGALLQPDYLGFQDPFYQRPLTIRDIVSSGQTGTDTIEYVRLNTVTNNAAPVAEATSTATIGDGTGGTVTAAAGGLKPESGMAFVKASTTVKTIAHWLPATKRALADAAQIRTLIDQFLRYGLEEELEDQLLAGDGTGENFLGLTNVSGVQTQVAPAGAQTIPDVLRIARRKVRIGGRANPTAFVLNPIDWENIELMRDANEQYYGAGPFSMTPPRLWGLPVVESEAVAAGTAWVGDWRWAVLFDREQANITVTDSHADFFVRNLVAILAEMRAAFAVLRPQAFVKVTLA